MRQAYDHWQDQPGLFIPAVTGHTVLRSPGHTCDVSLHYSGFRTVFVRFFEFYKCYTEVSLTYCIASIGIRLVEHVQNCTQGAHLHYPGARSAAPCSKCVLGTIQHETCLSHVYVWIFTFPDLCSRIKRYNCFPRAGIQHMPHWTLLPRMYPFE